MTRTSRRTTVIPDLSELESLRDELRVRLHLASKEAKQQWDQIEQRLLELERLLENESGSIKGAAGDVAMAVTRVFADFMMRHLPSSGPAKAPVHDAMRKRVHTVRHDDTLAGAAQLMWEKDVGCLPVVDENDVVIAMITDRDICMASFVQWVHLGDSKVSSAMSRALCTCSPDDEIGEAAEVMRRHQVRRLPVVDDEGRAVGLISLGDVARYVRLHTPRGTTNLSESQVAEAFVAVCEPRMRSIPPPPPAGPIE
jgi:CBS-domain-containing membrane protein